MLIPKGSLLFAASALLLAGCSEPTETRVEKQGGSATQTGAERYLPEYTADGNVAVNSGADAAGTLRVPADYRDTYQYLGTWAVAADGTPGSKEMHIVYASPGAAAGHRATGTFADGTTLVKEVFEATTGPMTTGTVSHTKALKGWFVMVKDSKNSHPDNKL